MLSLDELKWNKAAVGLGILFFACIFAAAGCGKQESKLSYLDSIAEPIYVESTGNEENTGDADKAGNTGDAENAGDTEKAGNTGDALYMHGEQNTERAENAQNAKNGDDASFTDSGSDDVRRNETQQDDLMIESDRHFALIDASGETLETRVYAPYGYRRVEVEEDGFAQFLRSYPMKPDGAKVHLYDGSEKANQNDHVAVFALPLEDYDLQQCADSVMRMYGEYYFATGQYDKIKFHFTNGFLAEYTKWRDGNRITVNGNNVTWVKSKSKDASYECLVRYFRTVFCYAGTLSMDGEATPTTLDRIKAGDVFLNGGSPGHVVMVVDVCENGQGEKAFLLAQGYMPAQEFHLLKNPAHEDDPWYYAAEVTYPFYTPEYVFQEGSLKSLSY